MILLLKMKTGIYWKYTGVSSIKIDGIEVSEMPNGSNFHNIKVDIKYDYIEKVEEKNL